MINENPIKKYTQNPLGIDSLKKTGLILNADTFKTNEQIQTTDIQTYTVLFHYIEEVIYYKKSIIEH